MDKKYGVHDYRCSKCRRLMHLYDKQSQYGCTCGGDWIKEEKTEIKSIGKNQVEIPDDAWLLAYIEKHKCVGCAKISKCKIIGDIIKVGNKHDVRIDFTIGFCPHRNEKDVV